MSKLCTHDNQQIIFKKKQPTNDIFVSPKKRTFLYISKLVEIADKKKELKSTKELHPVVNFLDNIGFCTKMYLSRASGSFFLSLNKILK